MGLMQRKYTRPGKVNGTDGDFMCRQCGAFVSANTAISGVRNRNHCPYCLTSRHLDLFEAGDRLSACKGQMLPIGITVKSLVKKYPGQGELMLVHRCEDCGKVSINRIAGDDDTQMLRIVLEQSANLHEDTLDLLTRQEVTLLDSTQSHLVR